MPSKKKKYSARFPPARIKKIMQTDEDVGKVAAPVPVVISRALELFIESLIMKSADHTKARHAKTLSASHIKQIILSEKKFDFLKDLVANIPDVQANEDDVSEGSIETAIPVCPPPPKPPRAKPPPLAPGQPPRPRGRPRKKREGEEAPIATPVKRRHSEEEVKKDSDTEGTDSDPAEEEEEDSEPEGPSTSALINAGASSSVPHDQNLPGPSRMTVSSNHMTIDPSDPAATPLNATATTNTFHTLSPVVLQPMAATDSLQTLNPGSQENIQASYTPGALSNNERSAQQMNQTSGDGVKNAFTGNESLAHTIPLGSTTTMVSPPPMPNPPATLNNGVGSFPSGAAQTTTPHPGTITNAQGPRFSKYNEIKIEQNSWEVPSNPNLKLSDDAETFSAISSSLKSVNESMPTDPLTSREVYEHTANRSVIGKSQQYTSESPPLNPSLINTSAFHKESLLHSNLNHTCDTKVGLSEYSELKPSVQNGEHFMSGQTKPMHAATGKLQVDTNIERKTFEKWSPTKAGVLDLSLNKRDKDQIDVKMKREGNSDSYTPLNLAVSPSDTIHSSKQDADITTSHIIKKSDKIEKPSVISQSNTVVKKTTVPGLAVPPSGENVSSKGDTFPGMSGRTMLPPTGYPPGAPTATPMMGLPPGYQLMPGCFPPYGMMPPFNGLNQLSGMTPSMMQPYGTPPGFYMPATYPGAPMMAGYTPQPHSTTASNNLTAPQTDKAVSKPS